MKYKYTAISHTVSKHHTLFEIYSVLVLDGEKVGSLNCVEKQNILNKLSSRTCIKMDAKIIKYWETLNSHSNTITQLSLATLQQHRIILQPSDKHVYYKAQQNVLSKKIQVKVWKHHTKYCKRK